MRIIINGVSYDIGNYLQYAQKNDDGAFQDKVKYRLVQQNNLLLQVIQAMAQDLTDIRGIIDNLISIYIWAADDDTIMAADDDTILAFYTYSYEGDS